MKRILILSAIASLLGGCAEFAPATIMPTHGRAFFVRTQLGSELWICDAHDGAPVCYSTRGG